MAVQQHPAIIVDEIYDFLLSAPSLRQVRDYEVSETIEERIEYLLARNRQSVISDDEQLELNEFMAISHLLTMLKIRAEELMERA